MTEPRHVHFHQKARYLTCGSLTEDTSYVWLCCHGYGQLATYFKRRFDHLGEEHFVIVPEGQHRFYLKGTDGRVGASWMSKEDRETDIRNYLSYLDAVVTDALGERGLEGRRFITLGFSQGTATIGRWVAHSALPVDHLILWAGAFPHDVDLGLESRRFSAISIHLLYGESDPYLTEERGRQLTALLDEADLHYDETVFDGMHEIPEEVLRELTGRIL